MRYLREFNQRLRELREARHVTRAEVAAACDTDERTVEAWESRDLSLRSYPSVPELIDLCQRLEVTLESMLDPDSLVDPGQLELPGLAFSNSDELSGAIDELERELARVRPLPDAD